MHLKIFFEFSSGTERRLDLKINGTSAPVNIDRYQNRSVLSFEAPDYKSDNIQLVLALPNYSGTLRAYFTDQVTGRLFVETFTILEKRKDYQFNIKLSLLQNKLSDGGRGGRPVSKTPPKKRVYRSEINFSKDEKLIEKQPDPDYSYYSDQPSRDDLLTKKSDDNPNVLVEVFYATDRARKKRKKGRRITYTNSRGKLELGKCLVTVPGNRNKGELADKPWYVISSDENKYMFIKEVSSLEAGDFFKEITDKVQSSPEKDALVFFHGYNVDFTGSVLRTAQMAVDIGFHGAPIVYSWPSRKKWYQYNADEATATGYSTENIIQLLKDIRTTTGAERVHLIAHSMGNRFLTDSLNSMVDRGFDKKFTFNQVILAAPDLDAEVFVKYVAPKIIGFAQRVTLYASQYDNALWFSKKVHGNIQRAGSSSEELACVEGLDTIDASIEKTDFLGHGYYADSNKLVDDIFHTTRFNKSPEERNLRKKISEGRFYWEFW